MNSNSSLKMAAFALGLSTCLVSGVSHATMNGDSFDVSANMALASDYAFRGISQSDENFAVQGGFDVGHTSGLYAGVWASNVDFNDSDQANIEIDLYAGYAGEIGNVSYDVGALYYAYPGARDSLDYDFFEVYGSLGYDFGAFGLGVGLNYSPDYFGGSGDATYTYLGFEAPLSENFTLGGEIGHQEIDDNTAFGTPDYTTWNVGVGYDWRNMNFSLAYHDTDLDEPGECADGCSERIIFTVSTEIGIE